MSTQSFFTVYPFAEGLLGKEPVSSIVTAIMDSEIYNLVYGYNSCQIFFFNAEGQLVSKYGRSGPNQSFKEELQEKIFSNVVEIAERKMGKVASPSPPAFINLKDYLKKLEDGDQVTSVLVYFFEDKGAVYIIPRIKGKKILESIIRCEEIAVITESRLQHRLREEVSPPSCFKRRSLRKRMLR